MDIDQYLSKLPPTTDARAQRSRRSLERRLRRYLSYRGGDQLDLEGAAWAKLATRLGLLGERGWRGVVENPEAVLDGLKQPQKKRPRRPKTTETPLTE